MDDDAGFAGTTAVITGAGSGIGRALAHHAVGRGMAVVLADLSAERLDEVAAELGGATVRTVPTDVSDWAAVEHLAEVAYAELAPVRLLVNNAGIETTGALWEIPVDRWDRMLAVNVSGVFYGVRAFVPRMLAQGSRAHVVNLSSIGGLSVGPFQASYIASKFAVQAITESLAMELEARGAPIGVSVVNPGPVTTRIFEDAPGQQAEGDQAYLGSMRSLLQDGGLPAARVAEIIFDHVAEGRFWIFTHPEMVDQAVQHRTEMLLTRTPPRPRPQG